MSDAACRLMAMCSGSRFRWGAVKPPRVCPRACRGNVPFSASAVARLRPGSRQRRFNVRVGAFVRRVHTCVCVACYSRRPLVETSVRDDHANAGGLLRCVVSV